MTKAYRRGTTETFSVSVDSETKAALRELANLEFGGNLSALIADFAEEARRRKAAGDYVRRHGWTRLTPSEAKALVEGIDRELAPRTRARRTKVA